MPDDKTQEQYPYHRRFVRHRVRLRVQVSLDRSYQTWTLNLSEGGSCFEIPEEVPIGHQVGVWIFPTNSQAPAIESSAKVVWSDKGKKGYRHGAQFLTFVEDGLVQLRALLATL
jgi:hypothetical protein